WFFRRGQRGPHGRGVGRERGRPLRILGEFAGKDDERPHDVQEIDALSLLPGIERPKELLEDDGPDATDSAILYVERVRHLDQPLKLVTRYLAEEPSVLVKRHVPFVDGDKHGEEEWRQPVPKAEGRLLQLGEELGNLEPRSVLSSHDVQDAREHWPDV